MLKTAKKPDDGERRSIQDIAPQARWWTLMLAWSIGVVAFTFCQGHFSSPALAVIGCVSWIWLARNGNAWLAFVLIAVGNVFAWQFAYNGMVPMPAIARYGVFTGMSLAFSFVFLVDRWVVRRGDSGRKWLWTTLAFPCGYVAFDYSVTVFSPTGSWSSIAYAYVGTPPDQLASLVGWTSLTFLTGFSAALLVNSITAGVANSSRIRYLSIAVITLLAAVTFGSIRASESFADSLASSSTDNKASSFCLLRP